MLLSNFQVKWLNAISNLMRQIFSSETGYYKSYVKAHLLGK